MASWSTLALSAEGADGGGDAGGGGGSGVLAQRHNHAAACVGQSVWVYGGLQGGALSDQLLELWPGTWSWCQRHTAGPRPPATMLHTMVAYGDQIILFGGLVQGAKTSVATNQLWLLHTAQCAWASPVFDGEAPAARIGHAAALREVGDGSAQLFVYGGYATEQREYLNDFAVLSLPTGVWSRPNISLGKGVMPPLCTSATLTALGGPHGALLLLGGSQNKQVTDTAMLLETAPPEGGPMVLSRVPLTTSPPSSSASSAASAAGGAEGGGGGASRLRPSARCSHTATLVGDALYVYGGAAGEWEFDDVCKIDVRALRDGTGQRVLAWETLELAQSRAAGGGGGGGAGGGGVGGGGGGKPSVPLPRQHHVAVALGDGGDGALLVLGGCCGERILDEAILLRLPYEPPSGAAAAAAQEPLSPSASSHRLSTMGDPRTPHTPHAPRTPHTPHTPQMQQRQQQQMQQAMASPHPPSQPPPSHHAHAHPHAPGYHPALPPGVAGGHHQGSFGPPALALSEIGSALPAAHGVYAAQPSVAPSSYAPPSEVVGGGGYNHPHHQQMQMVPAAASASGLSAGGAAGGGGGGVSAAVAGAEVAAELLGRMHEAMVDLGAEVSSRVGADLTEKLRGLVEGPLAAHAQAQAQHAELARANARMGEELARTTSELSVAQRAAAEAGRRAAEQATELKVGYAVVQQQLQAAQHECAQWQRLHAAEARRVRQLEVELAQLRELQHQQQLRALGVAGGGGGGGKGQYQDGSGVGGSFDGGRRGSFDGGAGGAGGSGGGVGDGGALAAAVDAMHLHAPHQPLPPTPPLVVSSRSLPAELMAPQPSAVLEPAAAVALSKARSYEYDGGAPGGASPAPPPYREPERHK